MNNDPIGVFDSGIGGLTVVKRVIETLPNENYIYYADTDNVPYGTKPKEEVKKYINDAVNFLISKRVKAIVIACNTATAIAAEELREKYDIPIIGIMPAIKPAFENRREKRVMVMATPITVKSDKVLKVLKELNATEYVDLVPMPKLVEFAQNKDFESDKVKEYIIEQLKRYNLNDYSNLVLGCTHFPYFKNVLYGIFPEAIQIIDGSQGVANRLKVVLEEYNLLGNNEVSIEYYYSGKVVQNKEELDELLMKN